jgi:hypothetical protein
VAGYVTVELRARHLLRLQSANRIQYVDLLPRFDRQATNPSCFLSSSTTLTATAVYFFGHRTFRRENDPHWPTTWSYLAGKATEWDLTSSSLFAFSDLPLITNLARSNSTYTVPVNGLQYQDTADFYATVCFIVAYLKVEGVVERDWAALTKCVAEFPQLVPYSGGS